MTPLEAVERVNPLSAKYVRRDVTGDGIPESFCNIFIQDVADELAVPLPRKLANDLVLWLDSTDGQNLGWRRCDAVEARDAASAGAFTLATYRSSRGHGHIAVCIPSDGPDLQIAQAGSINFLRAGIAHGFGSLPVRYFTRS